MADIERWQVCESVDHVGPEQDATVHWRELGLMCDTCFGAFGDVRSLQHELARAAESLETEKSGHEHTVKVMTAQYLEVVRERDELRAALNRLSGQS